MMNKLAASELVLNDDGSVYHLNLLPEDIAEKIILVGDPDRVPKVSQYFDKVEIKKNKREFYTHTGTLRGERITVMSTGIGTENIDIVMNELDALVNIDLKEKEFKKEHSSLELFRLGTCGSVNPDVEVDNMLVTENVVGLDGLLHFYQDYQFENEFSKNFLEKFPYQNIKPLLYFSDWAKESAHYYQDAKYIGNTATFPGFYAPQGRQLRLKALDDHFLETLNDLGVTNFEMETSAIYGLSKLLGHKAITVNCVIANRRRGEFSADHHASEKMTIQWVLDRIIK
ncbi:nucleoside phosphorylase [Elizabethkingia anophelis]|uniref:nucleoside phosphorylase n=1 Tax=Elizabethkingia anophelis TaxID=1117645 RepID=UPI00038A1C68|nr:nucleoside phosphorylase [Elizabethkingia anophelis]EQB92941.1 phosphorylase [Elizabethkingia anophelis 502]MCT3896804.1 nucleoside phosphorylase [Elizabethkingia anophelis]MCT4121113.1 nucleoside phosphorylase [Elizabethkingia anophelis]MCT4325935.1 nucleoside phosphorylase [Elizabethkingia anophelis]MDV3506549.1 phosphorylase [Elizabethkingia anophelis]